MAIVLRSPVLAPASAPLFPLQVSADGRWLEYADGSRLDINGDGGWEIMTELGASDVATYLDDCQARGINVVLCSLIEHQYTSHSPKWLNAAGDAPFTGTLAGGSLDFTTPNEAYWTNVDAVIQACADRGIIVFAVMAYVGFEHGTDGWSVEVLANGTSRMSSYGTFLGNRYQNQGNLVFLVGGDGGPVSGTDVSAHYQALVTALRAADSTKLIAAHPAPNHSGDEDWGFVGLDLNSAYAYLDGGGFVITEVRTSRQENAGPTFLLESEYGNTYGNTEPLNRRETWQAILGGGCGNIYGQSPLWYFGVNGNDPGGESFADVKNLDWHNTLGSYGRQFLTYVQRLQAARDLSSLTPDYAHTVVTAGFGTESGAYAPVLANTDVLVAYTEGVALTVDRSQFTAATFTVRWYNPRTGATTNSGTATMGSGSQVFTPPDSNDWVLLLDRQALAMGDP